MPVGQVKTQIPFILNNQRAKIITICLPSQFLAARGGKVPAREERILLKEWD